MSDPTIKFVPDLERLTCAMGISLVWIHEIHVDSRYEHSFMLPDVIRHEKYHHRLLWARIAHKNWGVRCAYAFWGSLVHDLYIYISLSYLGTLCLMKNSGLLFFIGFTPTLCEA